MSKFKIVFVRHGESEWNRLNLFTGWYDCDLSAIGRGEAQKAGKAIKEAGIRFDEAYTSVLSRANQTCHEILHILGQTDIPIHYSWKLNERHYGDLTGQSKKEAVLEFGAEQVLLWRRSYSTPPPPISKKNPYYNRIRKNPRFKDIPEEDFPYSESLKMTIENRALPYWKSVIEPKIQSGKTLLIAAHGNLLRGFVKHLDNLSDEQILKLNLPTGIPFVYELNAELKPTLSMKFLCDDKLVRIEMDKIANQTASSKKISPINRNRPVTELERDLSSITE